MKNLLFLSVLFIISCQSSIERGNLNIPDRSILPGLATPIQLQYGVTKIYLEDYFLNPSEIDSIIWPEELTSKTIHDSNIVYINGELSSQLDVATFTISDSKFNILIKKSDFQKVTYTFNDPDGKVNDLKIRGSFNAWKSNANEFTKNNNNWSTDFILKPGNYEYKLILNGEEIADPQNPDSVSNGMGGWNSVLKVGNENARGIDIIPESINSDYDFTVSYNTDCEILAFIDNNLLPIDYIKKENSGFRVSIPELNSKGRNFLRIYGFSETGKSNDLLIPLEDGKIVIDPVSLDRSDWETSMMYFLMVDRFKNGDPSNDETVDDIEVLPSVNYYGGDLTGVDDVLASDYFNELGVNAIWLSPIVKNPKGAWGLWDKGGVTTKFTGYHGYWPISNTKPDLRFGNKQEVQSLLDNAHERDMNVLLDYVANHVHKEHPIYKEHPDWATDLYLPDGTMNTEKWDDHRLTTWFDTFLPTLDLRKMEIVEPLTDSALVWVTEYDFDGFRHDATKHIDNLYWRVLMKKLKEQVMVPQNKRIYQIGETYGSPDLINSYISSGLLDAQFDFNLYDATVDAFISDETSLNRLRDVLDASLSTYGYHHLMGNISGNQDRSRFITLADGDLKLSEDQKLAGWTREFGKPKPESYRKLSFLHAFNFAVPGIPVIYYGDEYGMPGAKDPDNRRMMKFEGLDEDEANLKSVVKKLLTLRSENLALSYGTTSIEVSSDQVMVIKRKYFENEVIIVINKSESPFELVLDKGEYHSTFGKSAQSTANQSQWTISSKSFDYLIK